MYQRHTIEERWTSIDVDSDFVEQYPRWSATRIMSVRSSIVVRGTCDRNMSVYDAVLRTLLAYATQGKPQPMPDSVLALVESILAVCRCFSRALLIGSDST